MLKLVLGRRARQEQWESSLVWFRLRYIDASALKRCLNLLSRKDACGRIALYYQPGKAVSELYLGVPESRSRICRQIAADFSLALKPKSPEVSIPKAGRFVAASNLPWGQPFIAHITEEYLFVCLFIGQKNRVGSFLPLSPGAKSHESPPNWELPQPAPAGLALRFPWDSLSAAIPKQFTETAPGSQNWSLGRTLQGKMLQVPGCLNLYGRQNSVTTWLVHQVTDRVAANPGRLVVLDGFGDLVPQLKRKSVITQLMGGRLTYLDIDSASGTNGFNPLAANPGENEDARLRRWQRWFKGMQVHPQALQMLSQARIDGVEDIPSMIKWLKQAERQEQFAAVSSLKTALERLIATRTLREWLEWPTNPLEILPEGVLLFSCKASDWARQQVLMAIFHSVTQIQNISLVIHGFNWEETTMVDSFKPTNVALSNGPLLPNSTVILTESHTQGAVTLANKLLAGDVLWQENLELLQRGEGVIVSEGARIWTSWNKPEAAISALN